MKSLKPLLAVILLLSGSFASAQITPTNPPPDRPPRYPDPGRPEPRPMPPQPRPEPRPPMPPPPPQRPPDRGSCLQDLCVGDRIYNVQREYREAEVYGIEARGTYLLRFLDNGGVGGNWSRSDLAVQRGCSDYFCVGSPALNIQREYRQVYVVGIQYDGKLVLRFQDNGGVGGNWSGADLAVQSGCGRTLCVGDYARNAQRQYREVVIVAIQRDNKYVVQFLDNNGVGGNWDDNDLVRTSR